MLHYYSYPIAKVGTVYYPTAPQGLPIQRGSIATPAKPTIRGFARGLPATAPTLPTIQEVSTSEVPNKQELTTTQGPSTKPEVPDKQGSTRKSAAARRLPAYLMRKLGLHRDNSGRGGLPRSLAEDPFFQYHHQRNSPSAEYFRDFPPAGGGPARRFGSNPRLYDNVGDRYFDDFNDQPPNGFGSLPRRNSQSRSPRPPSAAAGGGTERSIPVQRHGSQQAVPLPPPSPQPPRKAESELHTEKQPKPPSVNVVNVQPAVEINNSPPSSYTNGKLNPDRAAADNLSANSDLSAASDYSSDRARETNDTPPSLDAQNTQQPAKAMNGTGPPKFERKTSIDGCADQLINLLDDAEARVEHLREAANKLEIEKEQLLDILSNLKLNSEILRLGEGERDDINATADRILKRCKAVDVVVNTPRTDEQNRALEEVNNLIQGVLQKMQDDLDSSKDEKLQTVQRFLNACSPDEPSGQIDQRFQSKVIECTADDQKKIRRRLAQMISQIDRAERVCIPNF